MLRNLFFFLSLSLQILLYLFFLFLYSFMRLCTRTCECFSSLFKSLKKCFRIIMKKKRRENTFIVVFNEKDWVNRNKTLVWIVCLFVCLFACLFICLLLSNMIIMCDSGSKKVPTTVGSRYCQQTNETYTDFETAQCLTLRSGAHRQFVVHQKDIAMQL